MSLLIPCTKNMLLFCQGTVQRPSWREDAAYLSSVTLKSPAVLEKNGIFYIVDSEYMDYKNPRKSIESDGAFILDNLTIDGLNGYNGKRKLKHGDKLYGSENYHSVLYAIDPQKSEFLYNYLCADCCRNLVFLKKVKGYNIFRFDSQTQDLYFAIVVIQIKRLNKLLSPHIDYLKPVKERKTEIKAHNQYLEYIRVAVPIKAETDTLSTTYYTRPGN